MSEISLPVDFALLACRFEFLAVEQIRFPEGKAGNVFRGGLGLEFKRIACAPDCTEAKSCPRARECAYARFFEPVPGSGPSGLADPPRPFALRAAHLDGRTLAAGAAFWVDLHLFDLSAESLGYLRRAMGALARAGMGPGRGRAELTRVMGAEDPLQFDLGEARGGIDKVVVEFVTPTELKDGGALAASPEFGVLFRRLRDRISGLRALYGSGPLAVDFAEQGRRADRVKMTRCEVRHQEVERRSSRTGQRHPLGGFVGSAEYEGELGEFLPYLELARYTGVGRQTVWGKGELRVAAGGSSTCGSPPADCSLL